MKRKNFIAFNFLNLRFQHSFLLEPKERWLIAFSMYTNGEKLFKCRHSDSADIMECLHGIRFFSILWVIFGHTYITFLMTPTINMVALQDVCNIFHFVVLSFGDCNKF